MNTMMNDTAITIEKRKKPTPEEADLWGLTRDKRRLVKHREKNCECVDCYREMYGLPPLPTWEEEIKSFKFEEREVKRAKRAAKKEVKEGKQKTIMAFFGPKHGAKR